MLLVFKTLIGMFVSQGFTNSDVKSFWYNMILFHALLKFVSLLINSLTLAHNRMAFVTHCYNLMLSTFSNVAFYNYKWRWACMQKQYITLVLISQNYLNLPGSFCDLFLILKRYIPGKEWKAALNTTQSNLSFFILPLHNEMHIPVAFSIMKCTCL